MIRVSCWRSLISCDSSGISKLLEAECCGHSLGLCVRTLHLQLDWTTNKKPMRCRIAKQTVLCKGPVVIVSDAYIIDQDLARYCCTEYGVRKCST